MDGNRRNSSQARLNTQDSSESESDDEMDAEVEDELPEEAGEAAEEMDAGVADGLSPVSLGLNLRQRGLDCRED